MKISYAITVCNEFLEIQKLIPFLLENKRIKDEIVILYDSKNGDKEVLNYLLKFNKLPNVQTWRGFDFDGHFANWKNKLTEYCDGDYIFQIDADEFPNQALIENLPTILESNPDNEVYLVPRVNTVEGLTDEHIQIWGWNVNDKGWVNWPDYQWRIWKNKPKIKWKNKVHEVLDGHKSYAALPAQEELALYHPKDIKKQEKQNAYYNTL
tara:strand:- start:1309 stop:1935 length:627 start_codon:yes stop_codon:yes gene_type:complete